MGSKIFKYENAKVGWWKKQLWAFLRLLYKPSCVFFILNLAVNENKRGFSETRPAFFQALFWLNPRMVLANVTRACNQLFTVSPDYDAKGSKDVQEF